MAEVEAEKTGTGGTVAILGINGQLGREVARAFVRADWRVIGMARENRAGLDGVEFFAGDVKNVADTRRAVEEADIVVYGVNPSYDKWDRGRAEGMLARVLLALRGSGKTLMFPGNIYNYGARQHVIRPGTEQRPHREKGEIRKRMELQLQEASGEGLQVLIIRMGDFFGPGAGGTMLEKMIMQRARSNVLQYGGDLSIRHSWAYLPDAARAFVRVAGVRKELPPFRNFHFAGHFVSGRQLVEGVQAVMPGRARVAGVPWKMMRFIGVFVPLLREVVRMKYLWDEPHRLEDGEMEELLGSDFGTPFHEAIALSARSCLAE